QLLPERLLPRKDLSHHDAPAAPATSDRSPTAHPRATAPRRVSDSALAPHWRDAGRWFVPTRRSLAAPARSDRGGREPLRGRAPPRPVDRRPASGPGADRPGRNAPAR